MKVKKFNENNNNNKKYYLLIYNFETYELYPDFESADNQILEIVNSEKLDLDKIPDEELYFTDVGEAFEWHENMHGDIFLDIQELELLEKFDGSDKLKKMKDIHKYNL